jgi:hypothetical protein
MQGIHTYIPETNRVFTVHSVAAILHVLLMVHIALSAILNSFIVIIIIIIIILYLLEGFISQHAYS